MHLKKIKYLDEPAHNAQVDQCIYFNVLLGVLNPLLHDNAFWHLENTMHLEILWKVEHLLLRFSKV